LLMSYCGGVVGYHVSLTN